MRKTIFVCYWLCGTLGISAQETTKADLFYVYNGVSPQVDETSVRADVNEGKIIEVKQLFEIISQAKRERAANNLNKLTAGLMAGVQAMNQVQNQKEEQKLQVAALNASQSKQIVDNRPLTAQARPTQPFSGDLLTRSSQNQQYKNNLPLTSSNAATYYQQNEEFQKLSPEEQYQYVYGNKSEGQSSASNATKVRGLLNGNTPVFLMVSYPNNANPFVESIRKGDAASLPVHDTNWIPVRQSASNTSETFDGKLARDYKYKVSLPVTTGMKGVVYF